MAQPASARQPAEPLWGKETTLAIANFPVSGRPLPIEVIHALAAIKAEAAAVNVELGAPGVTTEIAAALTDAASAVERGEHDDQFLIDIFQTGSGTSSNMNVNEVVARLASDRSGTKVHPNDHVNAGQSSNDTFPTAVAIAALRSIMTNLRPALDRLVGSLDAAADRFSRVVKSGRTHLMDAVPVMLGAEFGGYAAQVREAIERLDDCLPRLGRVPLGGTAIGSGLNAHPQFGEQVVARIAERWSIPLSVAPNRYAAQASRDSIVEASAQLRGLAMALIKIANDIRLMGSGPSAGLGEIRLPELQAGSSIMPGKVNPVMAEMLTQVCVQVFGNDAAVAFAGSQGAFELNTYQPVMAANVLDSIRLLTAGCTLFAEKCTDGLEADEQRCRQFAEASPSIATALNAALGYDTVSKLVKQAVAERRSIIDVVVESGAMDRPTAEQLVDVAHMAAGSGAG
jgi:fumarate hydratase class II